ncbi:MAG TPA: aldehyde dehydrogenase family protein [Candidatus Binatia bacterium]|nr:aldehyde dehydrogenase family protein [Candidatus Binatia bacterium]
MQSYAMVIDGRSVSTSEQDPVINPAFGEPFATCARATKAHVAEAVDAAERAFKTWRKDEALRRAKLGECASVLQAKAAEIAPVLSQEQGKPLNHAMMEIFGASMWFGYFAGLQIEREILQDDADKRIEVVRKPLGVVAAITPWNFPVILLSWKLAPALLAGNTVVAKPSPYTPLSSLMFAEAIREVLPAGVVNVLSGGNDLGAELTRHPGVRKISFTGSVATGKKVMLSAAEDLKRVTLELGGNDPAIVLDDVDPDQVAESLFWGAFQNSGQVCSAIKRLYVPEKLHDQIVARLVDRAKKTKVGNGLEADVELGPINNEMQFTKVLGLVEDAKKAGGRIEVGGDRLGSKGYFLPPTIVTNVGEGVKLVDEEQFGTALPIIKYKHLSDAIEQANRTHYGLGASVWTKSLDRGEELARELDAGTTWVNQHLDLSPTQPFGGHKWSGIGVENGPWGYKEFTQIQVVDAKK